MKLTQKEKLIAITVLMAYLKNGKHTYEDVKTIEKIIEKLEEGI